MTNRLEIIPIPPITEEQPALLVIYTCTRCNADCKATLASPGFLPRYCLPCAAILKRDKSAARQVAWRAEHMEDAKRLGRERARATRAAAKAVPVNLPEQEIGETRNIVAEPLPDWTADRFGARLSVETVFASCSAEYERRHNATWNWQDLQYRLGAYYVTALGYPQFLGKRSAAIAAMCRYVTSGRDNAAARRDGAQPTARKSKQ